MVTKLVTDLKVSPSDWLTNQTSVNKPWQIWYRYNGKLVKIQRMNREKGYKSRVLLTKSILKAENEKLRVYGYNPLTKTYLIAPPYEAIESADFNNEYDFARALEFAYTQLKCVPHTLIDVKSFLKYACQSMSTLQLSHIPIDQVSRKHIKAVMNHCEEVRNLSCRSWNAYRAYFMMLFNELDELELIDQNPVRGLKKKKEVFKPRKILNPSERNRIKEYLFTHHPEFYRFVQIFFHSGCRRTELLSLMVKDVNLQASEFTVLVRKGRQGRYQKKIIKDVALSYWREQLLNAHPEDYVFGNSLLPGSHKIREEQVTRRWKRIVKDKLGITADLYSLKHLNTDETAALLDIEAAAMHNGHTSTEITKRHYAFGEEARALNNLRKVNNEL